MSGFLSTLGRQVLIILVFTKRRVNQFVFNIIIFWGLTSCSLVEVQQRIEGISIFIVEEIYSEDSGTGSCETSKNYYQTVQYHMVEYSNIHRHRSEDLRSHRVYFDRRNMFCHYLRDSCYKYSSYPKHKRMTLTDASLMIIDLITYS